jgi:diguanylate cyclase (GGDEF)-like protein
MREGDLTTLAPARGELALLMRATEALLLAAHDEQAVLATATNLLGEHFGYGTRSVLLYQKGADELVMGHAAGVGSDDPDVRGFKRKVGEGLSGIAAKTRSIVNVGDMAADPRTIRIGPGHRSRLCVPMLVRDELLGVVVVESPRANAFGPRDEEILTAFCEVTALALIHARADERRRSDIAQLQVINDVATAAARLDPDATLRAATEGFQRATSADSTAIYLWDETIGKLALAQVTFDPQFYPPDYEKRMRDHPLALGEGMIGWAAQHREAAMIDDVAKDPRPQPVQGVPLGSKAAIVIPLVVEDRLLGVVRAVKIGVGSLSLDQFRFARTLANQLALLLAAAKARAEEQQRYTELTAVHEVSRRVSDASRLSEVLSYVLDGAIRLTGAESGLIWRLDAEKDEFFLAASHNLPADAVAQFPPNRPDSVSRRIIATGRPFRVSDVQVIGRSRWPSTVPDLHAMIGIPLRSEGQAYGTLLLLHRETGQFQEKHERVLEVIASQAASAVARAEALEEAERLAITDALTGLYNARYFSGRLEIEVQRAARYEHRLALLIVDSDALKRVNDKLGHAAGNELLVQLARTVRQHVRATDLVSRFGGDEFVVLQPETGIDAAVVIAERIRQAAYAASDAAGVERSVSVGIATYPASARDGASLFQAADDALYHAKRAGKNRVEVARNGQGPSAAPS